MQIYIFIEPKFRPDEHHLCTALEVMKVAGETLQRSWRTSPAAGSYQQPCSVCVSLNALGLVTVFLPVSYNMS